MKSWTEQDPFWQRLEGENQVSMKKSNHCIVVFLLLLLFLFENYIGQNLNWIGADNQLSTHKARVLGK